MKNIIIFGPPGTGKGTMGKLIAEEYGINHISTGDIMRKNQAEGTELGKLADKIINDGNLIPDDVINKMIFKMYKDNPDSPGFILDGYPRTYEQAKAFDAFCLENGTPIDSILVLEDRWDVLKKRLLERAKKEGRVDDTIDIIKHRYQIYNDTTKPLLQYFTGRNMIKIINASKSKDEVFNKIKEEL